MSFITFLFYLLKKILEIITLNHIVTQGASKLYNLFIYKETISIKARTQFHVKFVDTGIKITQNKISRNVIMNEKNS
jgi:hypothetical protein